MVEHDRSTVRGEMATRGLYVFNHDSELGNARAHALFDRRLKVTLVSKDAVARNFESYQVSFDGNPVAICRPITAEAGVTLQRKC